MVKLWRYGSERAWLHAIETGDAYFLNDAFEWASTEEGCEYWNGICQSGVKLSQKTIDRVAYLYTEWKLLGDIDDGGGKVHGQQEEWKDWEESTGENG